MKATITVGYKVNGCSRLTAYQNAMVRDNYTRNTSSTL